MNDIVCFWNIIPILYAPTTVLDVGGGSIGVFGLTRFSMLFGFFTLLAVHKSWSSILLLFLSSFSIVVSEDIYKVILVLVTLLSPSFDLEFFHCPDLHSLFLHYVYFFVCLVYDIDHRAYLVCITYTFLVTSIPGFGP